MPEAVSVSVAKGVLAMLAAATLSKTISPERSYADWEMLLELAEEDGLRVDVVAVTTEQKTDLSSRGSSQFLIPIDIAVRRKFGVDRQDDDTGRIEIAEIDALCLLVQEIHELFTPLRLVDFTAGVWQENRILVCPIKEHLRLNRQFTGIVRVTFRVDKDVA